MHSTYRGIFPPLITPILGDESPDLDSLSRLVSFLLDAGVHGVWAMGTSAEFAAFNQAQRAEVIATIVEEVDHRVPVIANISDAGTRLAIEHGRAALAAGASALAATPPYYYPHSQDEVRAHYEALRSALDAPLFIYNIPQTVRVRVELPTAKALVEDGIVAGIKDSQNDLEWFRQLAMFAHRIEADFALFAGTRHLIDAAVLAGADGAIPSVANAFPHLCVQVFNAAAQGDFARAGEVEASIIAIESMVDMIQPGSRNAAVLGLQKALLVDRGIIAGAGLTAPLRQPEKCDLERIVRMAIGVAGEGQDT